MSKKEMYDKSLVDLRTYINGDIAIKPYYYLRNGLLHVRYNVDRCVELSEAEENGLKIQLSANPSNKQAVLAKAWKFFTDCVEKSIIMDGIAEIEKRIDVFRKKAEKRNERFKA